MEPFPQKKKRGKVVYYTAVEKAAVQVHSPALQQSTTDLAVSPCDLFF